jgi:hypothetical protein
MNIKLATSIDAKLNKIQNLAIPELDGDAASKAYVDTGDAAAQAYTDAGDAAVQAYADTGDAAVQADAQAYADANLAGYPISGTPDAGQLAEFNGTTWEFIDVTLPERIQPEVYATSGYYFAAFVGGSGSSSSLRSITLNSNSLYFAPFVPAADVEIQGLGINIASYTSSGNVYASVYAGDGDGKKPSSRLAYTNAVSISSTGSKALPFVANTTLIKNKLYWLGLSATTYNTFYVDLVEPTSGYELDLTFCSSHPFCTHTSSSPSAAVFSYANTLYKSGVTGIHPDPISSVTIGSNIPAFSIRKA